MSSLDLDPLAHIIAEVLDQRIAPSLRRICIVDPPGHPNVGDSAILLGELDYLARRAPGARLSFFDVDSYSERADRLVARSDMILLHGGGNFGDIWPHHHDLRLRILHRFPDKTVIQLPQSISFTDPTVLARTRDVIRRHRDFTLLVRDTRSEAFARANFECDVLPCPDMAFAMAPLQRRPSRRDCFALLRTDKEVAVQHGEILDAIRHTGRGVESGDWLSEQRHLVTAADRALLRVTRRRPDLTAPMASWLVALRRRYAALRLSAGIDMLSRGRIVVGDRLHAMILCTLLGIPHIAFDSVDGKISAFHATWLAARPRTRIAARTDELGDLLATLEPA